jgi:hypothetical protein
LWEGGVIGLLLASGMFFAAFRAAGRLARHPVFDAWQVGLFQGLRAAVLLFFISLWHKNFFVFDVAYQTVVVAMLGYIAYWEVKSSDNSIPERNEVS